MSKRKEAYMDILGLGELEEKTYPPLFLLSPAPQRVSELLLTCIDALFQ